MAARFGFLPSPAAACRTTLPECRTIKGDDATMTEKAEAEVRLNIDASGGDFISCVMP